MSSRKRKLDFNNVDRPMALSGPIRRRRTPTRRSFNKRSLLSLMELKGVDTVVNLSPVISTTSTNASSFVLNLIVPGNGSWNRVGRKISMQSLRLKGTFYCSYAPAATTLAVLGAKIRMVVVYDKQPSSGTIPTFDTIFGTTLPAGTEACDFLDPLKFDNMGRFQLLKDKIVNCVPQCSPTITGSTNFVIAPFGFDEYVNLKGKTTIYSGQSDPQTIADISTGGLYVFFRASVNTAASTFWGVDDSFARLRYRDS